MEYTDIELKNEKWRDIDGYDGMYQVSDLGRVRSKHSGEWKVVRHRKVGRGYLNIFLWKDRKRKGHYIHRLVANAFIPNDDESKTQINHKNEDKTDNRVDNLEWCTASYNQTYNNLNLRRKNCKRSKIAKLYDPNLSIPKNIEIFKANGFECDEKTVRNFRKDIGMTNNKRDKLKDLYNPDLSIGDNIELFKANGIECCRNTVWNLRKDIGLTKQYKPRKPKQVDDVINQRQRPLERF